MNTMNKNYIIILDISNFTAYLYKNLSIKEKPETTEEIIRKYFGQATAIVHEEYFDKKDNEIILKPHRPTQKEYELFWTDVLN